MSKGIMRRIAALCSVVVVSGLAATGSAQAASPAPAAPKANVSVRLAPSGGPVVRLGPAIVEEYTVSPGGIAGLQETVRGAAQQAQAMPVKPGAAKSGRKA